ncbi:UNVERIFIED_CONTAM: hypothetical protein Sindi_0381200, partial [Sesamum indicum]
MILSEIRDQLLDSLQFQKGHLSMKYLGFSLISSRLTFLDCKTLLDKLDQRIKGWEGTSLSYAGRVQIIKSVLTALGVYWASTFMLPKSVIQEVVKRLWAFLWKGATAHGYAKVAWDCVCRPINEGDQGIQDITALNRALMGLKLWQVTR